MCLANQTIQTNTPLAPCTHPAHPPCSLDWPHGSTVSMDSSRRSSIDVARCSSAGGPGMMHAGRRSSSDSGSGSGSEEQLGMGGGSATGSLPAEGPAGGAPLLSNSELQVRRVGVLRKGCGGGAQDAGQLGWKPQDDTARPCSCRLRPPAEPD